MKTKKKEAPKKVVVAKKTAVKAMPKKKGY